MNNLEALQATKKHNDAEIESMAALLGQIEDVKTATAAVNVSNFRGDAHRRSCANLEAAHVAMNTAVEHIERVMKIRNEISQQVGAGIEQLTKKAKEAPKTDPLTHDQVTKAFPFRRYVGDSHVGIDSSAFGNVPVVAVRMSVYRFTDPVGTPSTWAALDGLYYPIIDGVITLGVALTREAA